MYIIIGILAGIIILQLIIMWKYQRQVKDICRQLAFLMKHDSNMLIHREFGLGGIGMLSDRLNDLLEFVIPKYEQEGKTQLVIAIGCTGGRHRSVTIAGEVFKRLTESGRYEIRLEHRDAGKDGGK